MPVSFTISKRLHLGPAQWGPLQALTLDEVNASIRKFLDPQKMVLVQAGTLPASEQK